MTNYANYMGLGSTGVPADGDTLTWDEATHFWKPSAGGGGGGLSLVDLGVVNAVDLLDGPQPIYETADQQYIQIIPNWVGATVMDGLTGLSVQLGDLAPQVGVAPYGIVMELQSTLPQHPGRVGDQAGNALAAIFADGSVMSAVLNTTDGINVITAPAAWQANHVYAADALIEESGHWWWAGAGGTSGMSIPDFPGNFGGTVTDNDITWTDDGPIPTQGTLHLYALVS